MSMKVNIILPEDKNKKQESGAAEQVASQQAQAIGDKDYVSGNELIDSCLDKFFNDQTEENFYLVLESIRTRMNDEGLFIVPVRIPENYDPNDPAPQLELGQLSTNDGKKWHAVFTTDAQFMKGPTCQVIKYPIGEFFKEVLEFGTSDGVMINPWDKAFTMERRLLEALFKINEQEAKQNAEN